MTFQITGQPTTLGVRDPLLDEGVAELAAVVEGANALLPGSVVADLRIARGLDYYTGTVYETQLVGYEQVGSICSGGRYDALASDGKVTYPGVGISLGVSRLLGVLLGWLIFGDNNALCFQEIEVAERRPVELIAALENDEDILPADGDV